MNTTITDISGTTALDEYGNPKESSRLSRNPSIVSNNEGDDQPNSGARTRTRPLSTSERKSMVDDANANHFNGGKEGEPRASARPETVFLQASRALTERLHQQLVRIHDNSE